MKFREYESFLETFLDRLLRGWPSPAGSGSSRLEDDDGIAEHSFGEHPTLLHELRKLHEEHDEPKTVASWAGEAELQPTPVDREEIIRAGSIW